MIKAVLFDFDETLQDRTKAFEKYMDTFFSAFLPDLTDGELEKRKEEMRKTGNGGYVERVKWYDALIKSWQWKNAPSATVLAEHYDTQFGNHNEVFPESASLLKSLKEQGFITGVITNGPSGLQHRKMETSGLLPCLDIVVVSGDLGVHKPDKDIFIHTAERLGLKPCECIYVGDHPINDIQGALSAGMKAVRMNYGWFKNIDLRADVPVIDSIIDVLKYINQ